MSVVGGFGEWLVPQLLPKLNISGQIVSVFCGRGAHRQRLGLRRRGVAGLGGTAEPPAAATRRLGFGAPVASGGGVGRESSMFFPTN